ncbi:hypothetical protein [Streptomyces sp. enrichment culture]|uniref:hypothetical protein n=1 Tax=Streptomyces sp. enrichment culture TaxID=1795815 RepID=UPI003F5631A2
MNHDQEEPEVVAVWHTASAVGRHFEELLADGTVQAWAEPPLGETVTLTERERDTGATAPRGMCHAALNIGAFVRFWSLGPPSRGCSRALA